MSFALSLLLLGTLAAAPLPAAPPPRTSRDTTALEFHGFRAGAGLAELDALVRRAGRGRLRCEGAANNRRVIECRGTLTDSELGGRVEVWISALDSVAGVITLSSRVDSTRLQAWRGTIESRYGRVAARAQGSQRMMQWVRRGRMLRLTWRTERKGTTASVSLVDGRVLDRWSGAAEVHSAGPANAAAPGSSPPYPPGSSRPPGRHAPARP